jgi:RimJ/RimL family protein N-acetyltransferase
MNTVRLTADPDAAGTYAFQLAGHLDDHWSTRFEGGTLHRNDDGSTTLIADVVDQAQLHGLLARIRDVGVTLVALNPVIAPVSDTPASDTRATPTTTEPAAPPVLARSLSTERLVLRPAEAGDADVTWKFRQLESVNEWLTGSPDDLDAYHDLFCDPARLATTVIVELPAGPGQPAPEVIGDFMLRREDAWAQLDVAHDAEGAQAELGWVLDPAYVGHGYATEAVRELLRYSFEDLGVHRVAANCFLGNEASWRLMERLGMRRELHAVAESLHRSGQWLDIVGYALLAEEWKDLPR